MKLNSPKSMQAAREVFRSYNYSWTAAREAAIRDSDGVLVIPRRPRRGGQGAPTSAQDAAATGRKAG